MIARKLAIQPKSQFLCHKKLPLRDFSIMTLILSVVLWLVEIVADPSLSNPKLLSSGQDYQNLSQRTSHRDISLWSWHSSRTSTSLLHILELVTSNAAFPHLKIKSGAKKQRRLVLSYCIHLFLTWNKGKQMVCIQIWLLRSKGNCQLPR